MGTVLCHLDKLNPLGPPKPNRASKGPIILCRAPRAKRGHEALGNILSPSTMLEAGCEVRPPAAQKTTRIASGSSADESNGRWFFRLKRKLAQGRRQGLEKRVPPSCTLQYVTLGQQSCVAGTSVNQL